jgi:hypothetical protein
LIHDFSIAMALSMRGGLASFYHARDAVLRSGGTSSLLACTAEN